MDLGAFLGLLLFSSVVVHPMGHVQAGGNLGTPVAVCWKTGTENWGAPTNKIVLDQNVKSDGWVGIINPRAKWVEAEINGAGFQSQFQFTNALLSTPYRKEALAANVVYGIWYLTYVSSFEINQDTDGDVKLIRGTSGNKYVSSILITAYTFELYQAMKKETPDWLPAVSFNTFGKGSPGLLFTWRI